MSLEASSSRECTCDHSEAFDDVLKYASKLQESQSQLEEHFKNLKASYQQDYYLIFEDLEELQNRRESLEERFIDLTDRYQNDVLNLKEELAVTAEKSADGSFDATQDFYGVLEACERRLFNLEQQQKEEEAVHRENWADTAAQTVEKLMDGLLAFITVLLVLMSTVNSWVAPFLKTCRQMLCMLLFLILLFFLWWHWDVILDSLHFCTQQPRNNK